MASMTGSNPTIAIIGGGPRGISVLERISSAYMSQYSGSDAAPHEGVARQDAARQDAAAAHENAAAPRLQIHVVDAVEPGAGRIWRTDQTRTLCMNTLADAVTLFTEPGSSVHAPVVEGPTMYEWVQLLRGDELSAEADPRGAKAELFQTHPGSVSEDFTPELQDMRPESHPSRALYGEYLRWVMDVVLARIPDGIDVQLHRARATHIDAIGTDRDRIRLDNGTVIDADSTVLALGWTDTEPDALETFTESSLQTHPELTWVRPGNPADQDISGIKPWSESHEEVSVRGLGMGFFDLMAMLTIDRGGRFVPDSETRSGLRYEPSGQEPKLLVTSFHGYPYQPKPVFGSLPPAAWTPRFRAAVAELNPAQIPENTLDFGEFLWPAILRDAQEAYYKVLLRDRPEALARVQTALDDPATDPWLFHENAGLDGVVDPADRFDIPFHADPVARFFSDANASHTELTIDDLTGAIGNSLEFDLTEARRGRDSAVKLGLQVIGAVRKPAAVVDEPGRFTTESRRTSYAELRRVGQMVGSGPPAFRTAELLCLVDAGYVRFLGGNPTMLIDPEQPAFVVSSPVTGDQPVASTTLVDAWLHKPDVRSTAEPLTGQLKDAHRLRDWKRSDGSGTRAPEVEAATSRLVTADGSVDPRVSLIGIPLQDVRADMTISPMPRTDPLMLQETDGAARAALAAALD